MFELVKFCKSSKINLKLQGFTAKFGNEVKSKSKQNPQSGVKAFLTQITNKHEIEVEEEQPVTFEGSSQVMAAVIGFLECLTYDYEDGRILLERQSTLGTSSVKYILLNPSPMFKDIVDKARSVIVCGGTMEPVSEFKRQLFMACGAAEDRIVHFSCDHIIPPENILPIALSSGPSGKTFDFTFQSRNSINVMNELGRTLVNVCNVVPGGVVCFFPSYDYEAQVYQHIANMGIIETISKKKKIFREPKKTSQVDAVLNEYSAIIKNVKKGKSSVNGCLLFSVVGGKLSEGLNFSDDLGRCVIVVGLPYPNINSPELQEKIAYLNKHNCPGHYEMVCMKAVNQCIGRAVRHRADFATVLLLDSRYHRPAVQNKLPRWIRRSLVSHSTFGPTMASITKFFRNKCT